MHRRLTAVAVASVLLLGLAACGDDDDDDGGFALPGAGQGTTQPGQAGAAGATGAGYTQAEHDDFVNECAGFPGASGELCECAWSSITQTVPYEEFQAFATDFAGGSTALPDWLTSAVATCS